MKKGYTGLLLPAMLLPYVALFALAGVFSSTQLPLFQWVMACVFQGNAWYLIAAVGCFVLLSIVSSLIFFALSICKKWDPLTLAKNAIFIKCIQIPAYLLIFVLGVVMLITIFTFPFAVALCFLDGVTLFLTGLVVNSSGINAVQQKRISRKDALLFAVLQFVFVADVISSVVLFRRLSKGKNS